MNTKDIGLLLNKLIFMMAIAGVISIFITKTDHYKFYLPILLVLSIMRIIVSLTEEKTFTKKR